MADQSTNTDAQAAEDAGGYWAANIRIITISLIIWALVSFGFGIVLRPMLAGIEVGGNRPWILVRSARLHSRLSCSDLLLRLAYEQARQGIWCRGITHGPVYA